MAPYRISHAPFVLLIAEDNDDDFAFMSLALSSASTPLDIRRVPDGQACMAYLDGDKTYSGMPFPDLLILDIDMPRMNGFDVMARIAADERLRHLRVAVFSSSSESEDVRRMYLAGCSSYVTKPMDSGDFRCSLHGIVHYWLSAVTLPEAKSIC
jgi:CheY-like chemotaxis protein